MKKVAGILLLLLQLSLVGCNSASGRKIIESTAEFSILATPVVTASVQETPTLEPTLQLTPTPAVTPVPTIAKEAFLPDWSDEYLDEYGYYENVSEDMMEEYIESLEMRGFQGFDWSISDNRQRTIYVRDDAWVTISYPYYIDGIYSKKNPVGYQIDVECEHHMGGIEKVKAASMIGDGGTGEPLSGILEITPDNMGEDCGLQVFRCLFGNQPGHCYTARFLVGEEAVAKELLYYVQDIVYTKKEGLLKNKAIIIQEVGTNGAVLLIRVFSSRNGIPIMEYQSFFFMCGKMRISLNERDGNVFLECVSRVFVGDGGHMHWWKDGEKWEFEIYISDEKLKLKDLDLSYGVLEEMEPYDWEKELFG